MRESLHFCLAFAYSVELKLVGGCMQGHVSTCRVCVYVRLPVISSTRDELTHDHLHDGFSGGEAPHLTPGPVLTYCGFVRLIICNQPAKRCTWAAAIQLLEIVCLEYLGFVENVNVNVRVDKISKFEIHKIISLRRKYMSILSIRGFI